VTQPGITIDIPGLGVRNILTIVSDYTGTLSFDGRLIAGVRERMNELADHVDIHIVTADTRGTAAEQLSGMRFKKMIKLVGDDQDCQKRTYVEQLDPRRVAVFGNGNNDRLLLRAARDAGGLAIAVDNGEGCAVDAIMSAHIFINGIANALDLLLYPKRCVATLRF
jgi:soluble P-type ATPase